MANSFFVATDLSTVLTNIATIDTVVAAIRATDITTITNAITAKNIRGQFRNADNANQGAAYTDLIDLTGEGKLVYFTVKTDGAGAGDVKVTIDGLNSSDFAIGNNQTLYLAPTVQQTSNYDIGLTIEATYANIEYISNCRIQYRNSANNLTVHCGYIEDP